MDIFLGGYTYLQSSSNEHLLPVGVYAHDALTWCVRHAQPQPKWANIFHVVRDRTSIPIGIITFFLVALCFYFLACINHLDYDIYTVMLKCLLAIIYAAPDWNMPKTLTRIAIMFGLWTGILSYTIFIHFYIIFINRSIDGYQIGTQSELIDDHFELAGADSSLEIIKNSGSTRTTIPSEMIDKFRLCPQVDDCLAELAVNDRLAVAVSRMHAMNNRRISQHMVYCFDGREKIIDYPISLMIASDHPMLKQTQLLTQRALEGGLLGKWLADSSPMEQTRREQNTNDESRKQTIEHIMPAIMTYCLFLTLAIVAFIAEHSIFVCVSGGAEGRFWQWADMLIDGKRHFLLPARKQCPRIRYG